MTNEQAIAQAAFELDLHGFTVLPAVIPQGEASRLCAVLDEGDARIGMDYTYDNAYARHVSCAPALDDGFLALADHPLVLGVVEAILGRELVLGSMNARITRPGDPEQGLHSDIPHSHRRLIGHPIMLQVTWILDGFTPAKGGTRIVPGSHRYPDSYPPAGLAVSYLVQPAADAGSVLIFNGQCWHGGGANTSDERRRAVFAHYRLDAWMRFQIDPSLFIGDEQWQRMTQRQRELMRMEHGPGQRTAADYYPDQPRASRYD